jgi:acyl-CoA synthetase (AMP-forming)/AMP-acid ligase II
MLISDILDRQADESGQNEALRCDDVLLTFAELRERVVRLSRAVAAATEPGARVAILAENCVEYVEAYYGVPRAGRVLTLLNYRLAAAEMARLVQNADPAILVVGADYLATARELLSAVPNPPRLLVIGEADGEEGFACFREAGAELPDPVRPSDGDPAWLLFTSGTTGTPKGALLTHRNVISGVLDSALAWGLSSPGALLLPWPMYHVAGYAILESHLEGSAVHVMKRFNATDFLTSIQRFAITDVTLAPTMLNMLLEAPDSSSYDLSSLRTVYYGSAVMPIEILRAAMHRLPQARFRTGFGMTELSGLAVYLSDADHQRAAQDRPHLLQSVGRPMPLVRVRLVDEDMVDVAQGTVGEIVVRGDQVVTEYWSGAGHPRDAVLDGWLRTGDLGRFDAEGYLYVVDRIKDMIITGGENVFSLEVEAALSSHPEVSLVAAFGVPDTHWGEIVAVAVCRVPGGTVSADELVAHARASLAGYKIPRRIFFVDQMPMNPSGKILKRRLRTELLPS